MLNGVTNVKENLLIFFAIVLNVCARCKGGNNAGHTIVVNGTKYDFHMLLSVLINPRCQNLIGSGVVIHIPSFFSELQTIVDKGVNVDNRLFISDRAHLVFDFHQITDKEDMASLIMILKQN